MLTLTRKSNQGITFKTDHGREFRLVVSNLKCGRVRIHIDAGKWLQILRDELIDTRNDSVDVAGNG